MGVTDAKILTCDVMHQRTAPAKNGFVYKVFYLWFPLKEMESMGNAILSINRFNLLSLYNKDHGYRDERSYQEWLEDQLNAFDLPHLLPENFDGEWYLLSLPRALGYVFNPVSFWCAMAPDGSLKAAIAEVNNTFGETHSYLLAHEDHRPIDAQEWIESDKQFHVSPFLEVKGKYRFRIDIRDNKLGIWIDYYEDGEEKTLLTSMVGPLQPYKTVTLAKSCLHIPFVTLKVIILIHYQALKLWLKKVRYICKPPHPGKFITRWPSV